MRFLKIIIALVLVTLVNGCNTLRGGKLLAPESFGLTPVTPNIYVEAGADEKTRNELREAMEQAKDAIRKAYGSVESHPIINACISEKCYESFGGGRTMAKVYGNRILLSPRALNWHFLAHEWSHDEIRTRLTLIAWWYLPQWFDDGLAVAISEAPEHSEAHWQFLISSNIPRPTPEELHTYESLSQWSDAIHKYGADKNFERKAKGEPEIRPVYTAAGHELRPWLARVGTKGLLNLIAHLNNGEDFIIAYEMAN